MICQTGGGAEVVLNVSPNLGFAVLIELVLKTNHNKMTEFRCMAHKNEWTCPILSDSFENVNNSKNIQNMQYQVKVYES